MENQLDKSELNIIEPVISIRNLKKKYKLYNKPSDRFKDTFGLTKKEYSVNYALKGFDLDINKGETVGIIGTNGSGKSTLLKIITGVLNPTEGEINVNGRISALLELGAGFNQEYNGIENVYLNGTMMGFTDEEITEKLPSILEFADIGDYVYQPVKTYSSGMFVRLAFAVAINIEPEILIVDEALSVGDVFFQSKCYHKFEEFKKAGKTILFVSHDLSSISKYCDRVIVLNKGEKLAEGKPKEMIDVYKQVLVGQYAAEKSDVLGDLNEEAHHDLLEYGNGDAHIDEYYVTDANGLKTNAIIKGSNFTIHMKVHFNNNVKQPIFAYKFVNAKGVEITGTNTMYEKHFIEEVKAGEDVEITFNQDMFLQGGEYLMSFGCTGYVLDTFTVYHRAYYAMSLSVISDKDTVGYYDMNSSVSVNILS